MHNVVPQLLNIDITLLFTDHTYFKSEEHTVTEVQGLKNTIVKLSNNNTKLRGEKRKLKSDLESCEEAVNRLKTSINTSDEKFENILSKAKGVSLEIYNRLQKKLKSETSYEPPYTDELREFALTLHNTSPSAYRLGQTWYRMPKKS